MKIYIRHHDDCSVPELRDTPSVFGPELDAIIDIPEETWERYKKFQDEFFTLEYELLGLINAS